jgi:hypothetical protein
MFGFMKNIFLSTDKIKNLAFTPWDFGNNILYKMCMENFEHKKHEHILAKVLFIGRIYAAAIERRKTEENEINDNFYFNKVVPTFMKSELDIMLKTLKVYSIITEENIPLILNTHHYLMQILKGITNLDKRSFCSKYLHFHLPSLFFIYDSRANKALKKISTQVPKELIENKRLESVDNEYSKFFYKSFVTKRNIEENFNTKISIRHFDNILIDIANNIGNKH